MSEPIRRIVLSQMSCQILILTKSIFRSVIAFLVVIANQAESQYEL